MSCSEYRFRPEAVDELSPREYVNAAFLHDFLFEVERDVSGEVFVGFVGEPYSGQKSVVDGAIQVEGVAKFGCGERMDVPHSRPAAEEVHASAASIANRQLCRRICSKIASSVGSLQNL